jgi:predicted transcriptional regulator
MKYRRRFEIIANILNAATENGAKKTRIMYAANLSYKLLEKYLDMTVRIGFMRLNKGCYEVTEKGALFLEKFKDFSSKYSELSREIEKIFVEKEILENMCRPNGFESRPTRRQG